MNGRIDNINVHHCCSLMTEHKINSASLAYFKLGDPIESMVLTHDKSKGNKTEETQYRVASLSKTIFAHLVEKLIEENKTKKKDKWIGEFTLPDSLKEKDKDFNLDTPLHLILPLEGLSGDDIEKAKLITARMVLSHTTGLPAKPGKGPHALLSAPGTQYSYSNLGFEYLQDVIEKLTQTTLEPLAQAHIFVPYGMTNTTYLPPIGEGGRAPRAIAQNSVHTTPTDYARFAMEIMNPKNQHEAFKMSSVSMMTDSWAAKQGLSEENLSRISWGNGWALQIDEHGKPENAFHWGDYGDAGLNWRAMVVLDLKKNEGMVFMSDSANGFLLADQIFNEKTVNLEHGLQFIFEKYGFARENELSNPHWEQVQWDRIGRIIALIEENIEIHDNKDANSLTVKCDPILSNWKSKEITDGIMAELEKFKNDNSNAKDHCNVEIEYDSKRNISALTINISDPKLYDAFISQLNDKKLLLALTPLPEQKVNLRNMNPSQTKEGPHSNANQEASRMKLGSQYKKIAEKVIPPKPSSKTSSEPATGTAMTEQTKKRPGMTPFSTELKPPGSK